MTVAETAPDFAHTRGAEHNRILKARKLARWCWDRGITVTDVLAADDKRRRAWARDAGVTPPSTMETWRAVNDAMNVQAGFAEDHPGHPSVVRAHLDQRGAWLGVLHEPAPAPMVAPERFEAPLGAEITEISPREAVSTPAPEVIYPRGWAERVALGPVGRRDALCALCNGPAVAFTRTVEREEWRCANHPPQPGQWGARLNWTPRTTTCQCASERCYCGRHPNFRLNRAS